MRTQTEMLNLIKKIAEENDDIRAAYMEGSRINPNAPMDIFQDYDIEFIVKEVRPFRENKAWIKSFGDILYMQYPEENVYYPTDIEKTYGWQIQFTDGNRLDLHVSTLEYALANLEQYQILIDKDNILPVQTNFSEAQYWVREPKEKEFQSTCSNFWWCTNNVAKGLWRKELPYAMDVINVILRPHLRRILEWKIGSENGFKVSVGKSGKYMSKYLSDQIYREYLATYSKADVMSVWESVMIMCDLYHRTALELSERLQYEYDTEMADKCIYYLRQIEKLPADAKEIILQG